MDYSVKASDISEIQTEFIDLWKIEKQFYHVQSSENDEYWDALIKAAERYRQVHRSYLASKLIYALLDSFGARAAQIDREAGKKIIGW